MGVMMGARDEETISSLAGRLARLNRQLDDAERRRIEQQTGGVELTGIVGNCWRPSTPTGSTPRRVRSILRSGTMNRHPTPWTRRATCWPPTPPACSPAS